MRRLALLLCLGLGLVVVGSTGVRVCGDPVDISGNVDLPNWINDWKQRDELAYPAHAWLGWWLNLVGCSPTAAGVQWLKAGAHARTHAEVLATSQGLRQSLARATNPREIEAYTLCRYFPAGWVRPQQAEAAQLAELSCPK